MKRILLALLLLASSAFADTTVAPMPAGTWTLMLGTANVLTGIATVEACRTAAAADAEKRKASASYRCRTDLTFAVTYAAPAPVPVQTWVKMAAEGGSFTVPANSSVRYGTGSAWITKTLSGAVQCTNTFFGSDPAVNVVKECDQLGGVAPAPTPTPAPSPAPAPALDPTPVSDPTPAPTPAPTGGLQASRTTCTAPCAVLFDATGMGDFRAVYGFDFGDERGQSWAVSGKPKNAEVGGPIAAHVYLSPGSFVAKVASASTTITVADPNGVYAGTKTVCVSPSSNFTGCPGGAAQQTAMPSGTGWSGKRVLLHTGEKFGDISVLDGNSGVQVGSYGTGAKPVVASVGIGNWRPTTKNFATDITVMDLNVSNQVSQSLGSRVLVLRNEIHLTPNSGGIPMSQGEADYWVRGDCCKNIPASDFRNAREIFWVENNAIGSDTNTGVAGFWGDGAYTALLGNRLGKYQQHSARMSALYKSVLSHNEFQGISADGIRLALKLHSMGYLPYRDELINDTSGRGGWATDQVVISNNLFGNAADTNAWMVAIAPQNGQTAEGLQNIIVENNRFVRGPNSSTDLVYWGRNITVRGNSPSPLRAGVDANTDPLPSSGWGNGPNYIGP